MLYQATLKSTGRNKLEGLPLSTTTQFKRTQLLLSEKNDCPVIGII